jgi:hypothetical protein
VLVARGEERRVRTAEAHRDAEALRRAERDVGAHGAGRFEKDQRHQVGGDGNDAMARLDGGNRAGEVGDFAAVVRVLEQRPEDFLQRGLFRRTENQLETEETGTGFQYVDGLREAIRVNKEQVRLRFADTPGHGHRFGGRSGLVEQRRVGQFHPRQIDDHLLVVEQRFQAPLRDFRLVRRVGRIPAWIFQYVAQDDARCLRVRVAHTDHRLVEAVFARDGLKRSQRFGLGTRLGERQCFGQADGGRDGLVDQRVERRGADGLQHGRDVVEGGADMAPDEFVALFKRAKGQGLWHGNPETESRGRGGAARPDVRRLFVGLHDANPIRGSDARRLTPPQRPRRRWRRAARRRRRCWPASS